MVETAVKKLNDAELVQALRVAKAAAEAADPGEGIENDGGTCNFDSPAIRFLRMSEAKVKRLAAEAGVELSDFTWWGGKRFWWLHCTKGQANRRTVMAEAACRALVAAGVDAQMYYQCD